MQYTLLDLTQSILSSIDSDEVNSINDTTESQQVVKIIKTVYDDIVSRGNLTASKTLFTLNASADVTKPVLMTKPFSIRDIEWLKYNKIEAGDTDPNWTEMIYLSPEDFLNYTEKYNPSESDVDTMVYSMNGFDFTLNFKNNVGPRYYTSFNDNDIIFDSYDSAVDGTLQSVKTRGYGTKNLTFLEIDGFVPDLPQDQFSLLLNEAKSLAWVELKQTPNIKAETTARRNWTHLARTRKHIPAKDLTEPNFGRRV